MSRKFIVTGAFPEPEWTQVPNKFFEMLPEMESSEARVTLIMIRETYGYHRESFKMGIGKLAEAAGISRNSAKDGAEAAEERGTFRRINPDEQTEAEWELIVGQPLTMVNHCIPDSQPLTPPQSTIDSQVGIKESIKENKEYIELLKKAGLEWMLLSGEHTQEMIEQALAEYQHKQNSTRMFEKALGFSTPLPWWSGKDWTAFSEWVCNEYAKSKTSFGEYNIWRNEKFTKGGIANTRIRGFPAEFYDSWDMFLMATKKNVELEYTRLL